MLSQNEDHSKTSTHLIALLQNIAAHAAINEEVTLETYNRRGILPDS